MRLPASCTALVANPRVHNWLPNMSMQYPALGVLPIAWHKATAAGITGSTNKRALRERRPLSVVCYLWYHLACPGLHGQLPPQLFLVSPYSANLCVCQPSFAHSTSIACLTIHALQPGTWSRSTSASASVASVRIPLGRSNPFCSVTGRPRQPWAGAKRYPETL